MASTGSNLGTRMSEEQYKLLCEIAFKYFKEHKVEISDAIKTLFPFLETLRDRGFVTSAMYKEFKTSWENLSPVQRVVYDVLSEVEKKFNLSLLEILFSKVLVNNYPDLKGIFTSFRNVIQNKIFHPATVGDKSTENRNTQLRIEQGTGGNSYPSLSWLFLDQSSSTALPDNRLSECLSETEDINEMDASTIRDNNALVTQQAIEQRAQEFEPVVTSSEDSVERRNREQPPPKASTSALKRKPESTNLRKSLTSGKKTCKRVKTPEASSGFSEKEKCPEARGSAVRSGADQEGFMDLGNKSDLQKPKKRRRARQQPGVSVNFRAQILHVDCGETRGLLIKRKLERGATRKCIRTEDGTWLTPREFEIRGGYEKASNWRNSLTCGGKTLKELMKLEFLQSPLITREIKNKEENSDKCKICQDGGKLFRCENCQSFFHGDCHLPPVDTKRNDWNCTFCTIENSSRSLQFYKESEILEKQMGHEKLKCEFLLLKVYHHLESNIFPNIPHGNYVKKATQYLGRLRKLDIIKKKLIMENYCKVKDFKEAMDKFFQDPMCEKLHLNQEDFMKNFKKVFSIHETN